MEISITGWGVGNSRQNGSDPFVSENKIVLIMGFMALWYSKCAKIQVLKQKLLIGTSIRVEVGRCSDVCLLYPLMRSDLQFMLWGVKDSFPDPPFGGKTYTKPFKSKMFSQKCLHSLYYYRKVIHL